MRARKSRPEDDAALFREAVRGATPLASPPRKRLEQNSPPPIPVQSLLDVHDTLSESLNAVDLFAETGEELLFLRDGLGREVLRKLRSGHWIVQDHVDLHGLNREQARSRLAEFLGACLKRGLRCVRVIHGKGLRSPGREPVLKGKVRQWLARHNDVLAFSQAPANEGGSGALLVLLSARAASRRKS